MVPNVEHSTGNMKTKNYNVTNSMYNANNTCCVWNTGERVVNAVRKHQAVLQGGGKS